MASVISNITIKGKLVLIIMLTCVATLLLAGTVFIAWEWANLRQALVRNLSTQAEMLGDNCKASLSFKDNKDANETLRSLHIESCIVFGGVYTDSGEIFASYYRGETDDSVRPSVIEQDSSKFADGLLTIFKPIVLDGQKIGVVCLRSDLCFIYKALTRNIGIVALIIAISSVAAYFFSSRLQKIISRPIQSLVDVAKLVSEKKDYSARVLKQSNDEVGLLIDSFNEMLQQIQQRDSVLVGANEQLETRVKERTIELTSANEQLTKEVAERKRAEQRQAELLDQVEKANQELRDFAYVVSHDLKAPLRGIKTLAGWMSSDYADKLDDNGKQQMNLLLSRVDRMHNLIDGILQYSRIGRVEDKQVQVNLIELVPEIIDMLAPPEHISIVVENELPTIQCEQTRITQVFQNLLSNAIKYIDKPQGKIRIGCVQDDSFWKFSVSDNGPGIEEKYFEKIFKIFQTLSPRDEFESTGIGLTVVKKIVEMYGGRIWLTSKVGEGTTFLFTLPVKQEVASDEKCQAGAVG